MTKAGLDPAKDVKLVQQQFDMQALLKGDIDAAQAMTYNEYAQVLEAKNPKTGKLYQPSDFNVINWNDEGIGDAPGRDLGQHRQAQRPRVPGPDDEVHQGERSRAGPTAATTPRSAAT